jgi:arylsulfatase A-like enzyme
MPFVTAVRKAFEAKHGPIDKGKARRLWREKYATIGTQTRGQQQPGFGPSGLRDEQHKDGKNARQIAAWLDKKAHGDKPFFMVCGIQKPHVPFLAPDQYFKMYPKESLKFSPAPARFWEQAPRTAMVKRFAGFGFELGVENDSLRRDYTQAYHACISFIDAQIGLVFETLKRSGHWDDTIIVLTSDHGYQLGEHSMWGKVTLFEVCDRVPLIIRVPGKTKAGSSSAGLVELVDLYPTLTELCDVSAPHKLQGRSLAPMLSDPKSAGKDAAYTVVTRGQKLGRAIRTDRWRFAIWPDGEELYDLNTDPAEHKNLAKSAKHANTVKTLRTQLARIERKAAGKEEHGFVPVFDGKTLKGWSAFPPNSLKAWDVKDGMLIGDGDKGQGYLAYKNKELANLEIKLSYRFPGKGNSGVDVRARVDTTGRRQLQSYHADFGHVGIGKQVLGAWDFHTPGRREHACFRGSRLVIDKNDEPHVTPIKNALTVTDVKQNDWNDVHIIAKDNNFKFFINGKLASEFTENIPREKRLEKGMITLQVHDPGMVVEFEDIRVRVLP